MGRRQAVPRGLLSRDRPKASRRGLLVDAGGASLLLEVLMFPARPRPKARGRQLLLSGSTVCMAGLEFRIMILTTGEAASSQPSQVSVSSGASYAPSVSRASPSSSSLRIRPLVRLRVTFRDWSTFACRCTRLSCARPVVGLLRKSRLGTGMVWGWMRSWAMQVFYAATDGEASWLSPSGSCLGLCFLCSLV